MPTIAELKKQIQDANALGRKNLLYKGVTLDKNATTYQIMSKIEDVIVSDDSPIVEITADEHGNIILLDNDGVTRTMELEYNSDGIIKSVTIGELEFEIQYDDFGNLYKLEKTMLELDNFPVDNDSDRIKPKISMSQYFTGAFNASANIPDISNIETSIAGSEVHA